MKTTRRRRGRKSPPSAHSCTRSPSAPRISLRAWELTDRLFQSSSTSPDTPSGPAATVVRARKARSTARRSETRWSPRRSTRRSKRISTDLMRPSSASAPVEVQALYQTVCTSEVSARRVSSASSASTSRIRLLLPIPQPASTASVKGVESWEAASSPASWRAARPAPSRSAAGSATGSSLSREKGTCGAGPGGGTAPGPAAGPGRAPGEGVVAIAGSVPPPCTAPPGSCEIGSAPRLRVPAARILPHPP